MIISQKEIELLRYLHAVKVSTYSRIQRDVYPEYNLQSVRNKVSKIEKMGLIKGLHNRIKVSDEKVLSISKKGFMEFVKNGHESRIELGSEAVMHDLKLSDLRHTLLKHPHFLNYYTENQIQTWGRSSLNEAVAQFVHLNSDAVVKINFKAGAVWAIVEFEKSAKAMERYDPVIKKYYHCDAVQLILYVCQDKLMITKLKDREKHLFPSSEPKFFYQLMDKMLTADTLTFSNYNDFSISFSKAPALVTHEF